MSTDTPTAPAPGDPPLVQVVPAPQPAFHLHLADVATKIGGLMTGMVTMGVIPGTTVLGQVIAAVGTCLLAIANALVNRQKGKAL